MLWGAVAYAGGIICRVHAWRPPLWWVLATFALILYAVYFRSRQPAFAWILAMAMLLFAGALHVQIRSAVLIGWIPPSRISRIASPYKPSLT